MHHPLFPALLAAVVLAAAPGCERQAPSATAAPETKTAKLHGAFDKAPATVKQAVDELEQSIKAKDYPRAFLQFQALSQNRDLTPEQQHALADLNAAVVGKLNEAASAGDNDASAVLKQYRSSR